MKIRIMKILYTNRNHENRHSGCTFSYESVWKNEANRLGTKPVHRKQVVGVFTLLSWKVTFFKQPVAKKASWPRSGDRSVSELPGSTLSQLSSEVLVQDYNRGPQLQFFVAKLISMLGLFVCFELHNGVF